MRYFFGGIQNMAGTRCVCLSEKKQDEKYPNKLIILDLEN